VVQIILLAMVALFVGLRLYAVLGRRTGHEQPIAKPVEAQPAVRSPRAMDVVREQTPAPGDALIEPRATDGVRAIVAADSSFDVGRFLDGARAAYRVVLEAFWRGDDAALAGLAGDEVRDAFAQAIEAREAAGEVLDNRLVSIERAAISAARIDGQMAVVTVRFDADIAAVTRDKDGNVIAGSLTDAVPTHDVWTFSRHVRAADPNWVLIETDEAA